MPRQGDIWWGESPEAKGRPYLVITRDQAIAVLRTVLVAPVTRTVRSIPTEVPLGPDEGLFTACTATLDNVLPFPKSMLVRRMGSIAPERRSALCAAWAATADC
jgi:mRNA interferase MazF